MSRMTHFVWKTTHPFWECEKSVIGFIIKWKWIFNHTDVKEVLHTQVCVSYMTKSQCDSLILSSNAVFEKLQQTVMFTYYYLTCKQCNSDLLARQQKFY